MASLRKTLLLSLFAPFALGGCASFSAPSESGEPIGAHAEQRPTTGSHFPDGNPVLRIHVIDEEEIATGSAANVLDVFQR